MTATVTGPDPEITAGRSRYDYLLTLLGQEGNRAERAGILGAMAEAAISLAGLTRGAAGLPADAGTGQLLAAEGDPATGDPLAWLDTASLLQRLAAAESGNYTSPGADPGEYLAWKTLTDAATADEHRRAAAALTGDLTHCGTVRRFARERFTEAAAACTAGYPGTYPGEQDYLAAHAAATGR